MPADDKMAENLASEVIQASTDFDGKERAPMRLAEARITLGVVAARQGDLDEARRTGCWMIPEPVSYPSSGESHTLREEFSWAHQSGST